MLAVWIKDISKLRWINRDVGSVSQQYLLSANVGSLFARYLPLDPDDQIYLPSRLHQAMCVFPECWQCQEQSSLLKRRWREKVEMSSCALYFFCPHTYWRWQAELILVCPEFVDKNCVFPFGSTLSTHTGALFTKFCHGLAPLFIFLVTISAISLSRYLPLHNCHIRPLFNPTFVASWLLFFVAQNIILTVADFVGQTWPSRHQNWFWVKGQRQRIGWSLLGSSSALPPTLRLLCTHTHRCTA